MKKFDVKKLQEHWKHFEVIIDQNKEIQLVPNDLDEKQKDLETREKELQERERASNALLGNQSDQQQRAINHDVLQDQAGQQEANVSSRMFDLMMQLRHDVEALKGANNNNNNEQQPSRDARQLNNGDVASLLRSNTSSAPTQHDVGMLGGLRRNHEPLESCW